MNIGDVQRLNVNQRRDFQRANAVVCALSIVPRGLVAIDATGFDSGVAGAFLGRKRWRTRRTQ